MGGEVDGMEGKLGNGGGIGNVWYNGSMKFTKSYEPGDFEPQIYAEWEKAGAFQPRELKRESDVQNCYSIVMPPPNANGNLHIGHGLTVALEDSLTRYYRLRGDSTWYVPGADHAGFETWVVYERNLEKGGHTRFEFSRDELYSRVWSFVEEQRGNMELQLRALGASCAWPDLTFTLDDKVVSRVYATFEKMWNDGMVYRGEKLVNFCPKHQTAFADIEVEHEDEDGYLWEISYKVRDSLSPSISSLETASAQSTHDKCASFRSNATNVATSRASSRKNKQVSSSLDSYDWTSSPCISSPITSSENSDIKNTLSEKGTSSKKSGGEKSSAEEITEIIVSTTRPETIFGDVAVAVNPADERYQGMIGKMLKLPLTDRLIPIIADEHADPAYGTGAVKITPAHDFDDFEVGNRHNLERIQVIGEDGRMLPTAGEAYAGLTTEECREKVLQDLEEQGLLRGKKKITHSVAHCYKCGTVIEPMLKSQWFIDVKRLAKTAIEHLENNEIKFHPANKKKVLINYLKNLKDWNISRQIPWGIPIPAFRKVQDSSFSRTTSLGSPVRGSSTLSTASLRASSLPSTSSKNTSSEDPNIRDNALNSITAEGLSEKAEKQATSSKITSSQKDSSSKESAASNADTAPEWIFDTRADQQEIEVDGVKYTRDEDTFDTWFSSSHWPIVCTEWQEGHNNPYYPLNVMETGADILFAWVARMIMMGLYVTGEVPFREVYLHGLVLDEHGQKMSKSKGNVINPMDLVTKYGSDAFRLGILRGRSAGMNQAFSENSVVAGRNLCNKLWNVARFVQSMVEEAHSDSPVAVEIANAEMNAEIVNEGAVAAGAQMPYSTDNMGEDWICRELTACKEKVEDDMANYRFSEAVETLYSTIWDKYADWFVESQKIYKNIALLKVTLEMILKMLHPFAPFVTEAIWQSLSWTDGMLIREKWPARLKFDPISAEQFENLITIVVEVRSTLQGLPAKYRGKKYTLLYGEDLLVDDNQLLTAKLAGLGSVISCEGQPRGLRLALANHELYLDVSAEVVKAYQASLEERILAVGRELDTLNLRMTNPNYVDKAPAKLVKQTRDQIAEKSELIERLKRELSVIE